jgi:hypothetical protein
MHFALRNTAILVVIGLLILCCSCEEHRVGELPTVQREHFELAGGSEEDSDVVKERSAAPAPSSANPTPPEFFPTATPR